MTLEVIRGGRDLDAFEALVDALRRVIEQIVDERTEQNAKVLNWRWMTTKQAAELLDVSPQWVATQVRQGKLPGRKYGGRMYVDRNELEKTIDRHRV